MKHLKFIQEIDQKSYINNQNFWMKLDNYQSSKYYLTNQRITLALQTPKLKKSATHA